MASFIPSYIQKRLLRYALSRTGLLDDKAIDLENLDITLGKRNVVELKDLGLNIPRLSALLQLPPRLRVETAKVLSLRLTVPADIYQSAISVEIDGIDLLLSLDDADEKAHVPPETRPVSTRAPQHRKVNRRLRSTPPYDPGGGQVHIPTAQDLARSFLQDEPLDERRDLEASVAARAGHDVEESIVSESSDAAELGTGAGLGLPSFLASFLQGIIDRLQVSIKNVHAKVNTHIQEDGQKAVPVALALRIVDLRVDGLGRVLTSEQVDTTLRPGKRRIELEGIAVELLCDGDTLADLSQLPSPGSPTSVRSTGRSPPSGDPSFSGPLPSEDRRPTTASTDRSFGSVAGGSRSEGGMASPEALMASMTSVNTERFADAVDDENLPFLPREDAELDIRPGEDNFSWSSRRSQTSAPSSDLWNSMAEEDDLPDSLLFQVEPRLAPSNADTWGVDGLDRSKARTPRAVSPYARSMNSPGSWPRLDESANQSRTVPGPGAWPRTDQSTQNFVQPSTPVPAGLTDDYLDNKRTAVEEGIGSAMEAPLGLQRCEDLSESVLYSHEEAESIYMSAITQDSRVNMPGGWASDGSPSERSVSPELVRNRPDGQLQSVPTLEERSATPKPGLMPRGVDDFTGPDTPRAKSPELKRSVPEKLVRHILTIDKVSLWLPSIATNGEITAEPESSPQQSNLRASRAPGSMPGTFAVYSDRSSLQRRRLSSSTQADVSSAVWSPQADANPASDVDEMLIKVGTVTGQLDVSVARLLHQIIRQGMTLVPAESDESSGTNSSTSSARQTRPPVSLSLDRLVLSFVGNDDVPAEHSPLFRLDIGGMVIAADSLTQEYRLDLAKVACFLGEHKLISFNRDQDLQASRIINLDDKDLSITVSAGKTTIAKRPVMEINVETLALDMLLDLQSIDETFSTFGGLSGIIELGSSVLSDSTTLASPDLSRKSRKGVRFEGDLPTMTGPELKLNARIGGLSLTLRGVECSVAARSTTIKTVYREQGARVSIDQVKIVGPHFSKSSEPSPIDLQLENLRLDYYFWPRDTDIERLLMLLTPSKDKYEDNEDIIVDALLRQRRKGAVLRVSTSNAKLKVANLECLASLKSLNSELAKLSAVTKYLPEDNRPGLLTLVRLDRASADLPVHLSFGRVGISCKDVNIAQVSIPSLFALGVGDLKIERSGHETLVHALVKTAAAEGLPMIMCRMLGNEVEPVIKLKVFNTCVEYSVPTIMALTGLDVVRPEDITDLAQSVANLTLPPASQTTHPPGANAQGNDQSSKKMKVEVLFHECGIGLTPQHGSAKGLLFLGNARFTTAVPQEEDFTATLEIRKAAFHITDDQDQDVEESRPLTHDARSSSSGFLADRLALVLSQHGYVNICSIRSARIMVNIHEHMNQQSKSIEVEVRDELFLLETCADSTQTLISILSGLAPPTPPGAHPKYLTEPMTIEDMLASFTGDAYAKPLRPPETLFDVNEEPELEGQAGLGVGLDGDDDDDLLKDSEMTSSLYGPVSGLIGGDLDDEDDVESKDFSETVESLLEADPFEMTASPTSQVLSDDALIADLQKQCRSAISDAPVDLELFELEDLGFDALRRDQNVLGAPQKFNTPASTKRIGGAVTQSEDLPFKLRVRDVQVLWHLYDGYDWQRTRDSIAEAVEEVEHKAEERKARHRTSKHGEEEEESVIGDILFNSIYIGVAPKSDVQDLRRQINRGIDDQNSETASYATSGMLRPASHSGGGRAARPRVRRRLRLERSKHHKITFELKGLFADVLVFPPGSGETVSSVDLRVRDFEIFDNVPTSTWRKFLTHMPVDEFPREMAKPMVHLELQNVRTMAEYAATEIVLRISILPLRLHVDQDALEFISRFFEFKDPNAISTSSPQDQPFLQRVEVNTVDLCLDYKPKNVDYAGLRSGRTTEFMNFIILEGTNIRLKHAIVYGLHGFEPLHQTLNDIWMPDVKRTQLPRVLAGLAPVRGIVNLGEGFRNVVAIPVREYRKDGRLLRSIQKGAFHFAKTTTSELARLGAKVAVGTQTALQGAEGFLSSESASPSARPGHGRRKSSDSDWHNLSDPPEQRAISNYADQPVGVWAGLRSARAYLEHDLLTAKDAFIAVQGELLDSSSPGAAAAAVARHAPTVILRPVIGASRAVGATLMGVGNQVDRGNVKRLEDKYKKR